MKLSQPLLVAALALAGSACVYAQNSCSVAMYGVHGDCIENDTQAFQKAADTCGSFYVPRPVGQGCYRVNGIRLRSGSIVTMEDRNTEIRPSSPNTPYIFEIAGRGNTEADYVTIRNGILWAPFPMADGTAGIKVQAANHIRIEDTIINGFYDDVFADDTQYLYLLHVGANGATHANVWHQQTGSQGGYFGGPLYIDHSTLDSCECSAASLWVQDIAVVNVTDTDIVGVTSGQGLHADSSNGRRGSSPDYPAGLHIHGSTFDSIASEPIWIANYIKSDMQGSWVSGGRKEGKSCIAMPEGVRDFSISETHVFWCGADGIDLGTVTGVKISNSTFSGSPKTGIHNISAARSAFYADTCDNQTFNGNGSSAEKYCVYEESGAKNNTYFMIDGSGTAHGNAFHGSRTTALIP